MTRQLFFDTETSGLADFRALPESPQQPFMLEFAWVARDTESKLTSRGNVYIDWDEPVPSRAQEVHGISQEFLLHNGVSPVEGVTLLAGLLRNANEIIGHNLSFDLKIFEIACAKLRVQTNGKIQVPYDEIMYNRKTYCTMLASTDIICLPSKFGRGGSHKWPNLTEAHRFFLSRGFEGAHGALSDIEATVRVYDALQEWLKENKRKLDEEVKAGRS